MKAESEVSIPFAISIFLDKEFTPDDNTLNNESYKELGLTCGKCRELIFFKPGRKRVSHFSHFKDTGKGCRWRTESHSNTQDSDSSKREQSLQEFQTKFKGIIERAIIQYQKISYSQLLSQIVKGKILVAEYNINIEAWLRWFNENRNKVENVALALYQKNELLSDMNSKVILNLLDYLCVPASEYILRELLYYVVFLLNKERGVNNNLEKVCSKVIEIISFAEWKKEYKRAKELVDTSKFEQDAHQEIVDFREYEIAPITFKRIDHPNVEEKTPKSQIQVERQTPKPIALDAAKTITGSKLVTKGVIVTTPMIITLEDEADKWKISGLPVKTPPYDLAIYLSDKLGIKDLIIHIDTTLSSLSLESEENKLLSLLKNDLLTGYKISKEQIASSTKIIQGCLDRAIPQHKALYLDNYYCPHVLGYVEFLEDKEKEFLTYALTVWGSERDTRRSEVPTVMNWLKRIPINLRNEFKSSYPSIEQIEKYLQSKFKGFRNCSLTVSSQFQGNTGMFIEVYYEGRLQTRQMLSITTPGHDNRIKGKTAVNISHRFNAMPPSTYLEVLKLSVAQKHLYQDAIGQLNDIAKKWVANNRIRFVGKEKVGSIVSVNSIVGFDNTAKSINQVIQTFKKWAAPFTVHSQVEKGKLINLLTLQTYNEFDVNELLQSIINGWKYWEKSKDEHIELGGNLVHKSDPGRLMMNVHHLVSDTPDISEIVWKDVINTFYQITGLAVGFRCVNGVVLTPYDMYLSGVERWNHRIKIQLIDLLYLDQCKKQQPAIKLLNEARESNDKKLKIEAPSKLASATFGSVESWLQYSVDKLKNKLEIVDPKWKTTKANSDVIKHLEALEEAWEISKEVEASVEI